MTDRTPILIGAGQARVDWDGATVADAPTPIGHVTYAAEKALRDTGVGEIVAKSLDSVAFIRRFDESFRVEVPFEGPVCPPAALAKQLGLEALQLTYSVAGGQVPQALVNEFASKVFDGECEVALIAGGEISTVKRQALKAGLNLDWSEQTEPVSHQVYDDRGLGEPMMTAYEAANGLLVPLQAYTLFEHALRLRMGRTVSEHVEVMSLLLAPFSSVAAHNEYAEYKQAYSPSELGTSSQDNFQVTDIYLKGHVAKNTVNHSAAVLCTSVDKAREMGVPEENWVYLHGSSDITEKPVIERQDLSRSPAMDKALDLTLAGAGLGIEEIEFLDLYSCFPCAVFFATEALGLDWDARPLTVTGGLPFFGAAGNGYSLNAIASMVERLRKKPQSFGLVLANGGFMQKQSTGVYSSQKKQDWAPAANAKSQVELDEISSPAFDAAPETGRILFSSVSIRKGEADFALIMGETEKGRFLAKARREDTAMRQSMLGKDMTGHPVKITKTDKVNYFELQ